MFRNNVIRNAAGAFGGQSIDNGNRSRPMKRIAIVNNLWLSIDRSFFTMAVPSAPLEDFLVDHNTAIPTRQFSYDIDPGISPALIRFQFTNNLTGFGSYGVKFPRTEAALVRWTPGAIVANNARSSCQTGDRPEAQGAAVAPYGEYVCGLRTPAAGLRMDGTLVRNSPLRGAGTVARISA
jgi:hypothetical protein